MWTHLNAVPPPTPLWFSNLYVCTCIMQRTFFPSRRILFQVQTADSISAGSQWYLTVKVRSQQQLFVENIKVFCTNFFKQKNWVWIDLHVLRRWEHVVRILVGCQGWGGSFCQVQFQFRASQVELRLAILPLSVHPPTRTSIFEPLLDYLGSWNLVWKLYSTKLCQLAN